MRSTFLPFSTPNIDYAEINGRMQGRVLGALTYERIEVCITALKGTNPCQGL